MADPANVVLNTDTILTDAVIDQLKSNVEKSKEIPLKRQWHSETSLDAIRHWAWGIGDNNPLWSEPDYAANTKHGAVLAPPSFFYSCNQGPNHFRSEPSKGEGLPGLHAVWAWDRWEFPEPTLRNTAVNTSKQEIEANVRDSKFGGGKSVEVVTRYIFRDDNEKVLATYDVAYMHFGRNLAAKKGNKHSKIERQVWSDEALEKLVSDVKKETEGRRGSKDLVWDEVTVGEEIGTVVKGPLSVTETIAFTIGWGGPFIMASECAHRYVADHPRANAPDRYMRIPEFPQRAHWDADWARECGFPDAYDYGGQRFGWMMHGVTDWMGDNAHLLKFEGKLLGLNIIGDASWCSGFVKDKYIDDSGRKCVELELKMTNQRDQVTTIAKAVVVTPR